MNATIPKIIPGKYQVTATCGEDEVLRQGFDDPASANEAFREALGRYPDCEIKLIEAGVVLISAGPAPPPPYAGALLMHG